MNHRNSKKSFSRSGDHRKALFINLAKSLIKHGKIETTDVKAKELRKFIEPLITKGKKDDLSTFRYLLSSLGGCVHSVRRLIYDISSRHSERKGGYLRILKLANRAGDGALKSRVEFVD